jgi:hypothetical protein
MKISILATTVLSLFLYTHPADAAPQVISINFGANNAGANINSLAQYLAGSSKASLVDSGGGTTPVGITVIKSFSNLNYNGTTSPAAAVGFPASVTSDSFFGNTAAFQGVTNAESQIKLTGLNPQLNYSLSFFASRMGDGSENRDTLYTAAGLSTASVTLNAYNNTSNLATITNIHSNHAGEILVTLTKGPNNQNAYGFFYLGALKLSTDGVLPTPTPSPSPTATPLPSGTDPNAGKVSLWKRSGANYPEKFYYDSAVYLPSDYGSNPNQQYAMILSLHGLGGTVMNTDHTAAGGNKEGFIKQVWDTALSPSFPAIVIAPSARLVGATADAWWSGSQLRDLIIAAKVKYKIDPNRVVVTGLSAGGDGVNQLIQNSKDLIAGFMPGAYNEDPFTNNACLLADVPIWAFGNSSDGTFQPEDWQKLATKVKACANYTGNFTVTVYQNTCGHGCWDDHWMKPEVQIWLSTQSKGGVIPPTPTATPVSTPVQTPTPAPTPPPVVCNGTVRTLIKNGGNDYYNPNGTGLNWQPGDTILIPAGNWGLIDIGNFKGSAECPITIINSGGQAVINQMRISNRAQYFKILGNGAVGVTYGLKINGTTNAAFAAWASDFELGYVEILNSEAGIMIKKNPILGDSTTQYPNYVFNNVRIHHNYVHDTHGEGMYIGHTYPNADPFNNNLVTIRMANVEIDHNTVNNTDWDGIQLSNATVNAKIHHNQVSNFGLINMGSQQAGIILGGNTNGDVYANSVSQGTGNGIQVFGYGVIHVYDNTVENVGQDGTAQGQESIYANDPLITVEQNLPLQQITFSNNTILNPQTRGAIRDAMYNSNSAAGSILNNQFRIPNAPSDWLNKFLLCGPAGCTKQRNALIP